MILITFGLFFYLYQVEAASLWCYGSKDYHTITPLTAPLGLLNSPFNASLPTVIFTFGFNGKVDGPETISVINAYNELKEKYAINVILLEWEKEASSEMADPKLQYPTTGIHNAKKLGCQLGDALIQLSRFGVDLNSVHLIGHSLGAHLVGHAGKRTQESGVKIKRITGLDPAGPLYTGPIHLIRGLEKTDAIFVDVVHTNPEYLGTSDSVGDIDIWFNCGIKYQPGCTDSEDSCSHFRAAFYYAESVKNPSAFPAVSANSCHNWKNGHYNKSDVLYLGIAYDNQARGNFYLKTNSQSPFGKGLDGIYP